MGKNSSVTLSDHFGEFVDRDALRAALAVGEASGPSTAFDFEAFIEGKRCSVNLPQSESCSLNSSASPRAN
ncbi:type II toxin-antitoxin system ParD family antitoxin [Brevundimonas sp.]|uniref:type II toxin-antitoxin system ParD family antitoxin n=1 Tax=Brevundimonas sp. TaxID=1871086 RepID=UPI001DB8A0D4|nr:type II toxin-antitoxin system ParD family antitoxin [Brevundimonas sp.]